MHELPRVLLHERLLTINAVQILQADLMQLQHWLKMTAVVAPSPAKGPMLGEIRGQRFRWQQSFEALNQHLRTRQESTQLIHFYFARDSTSLFSSYHLLRSILGVNRDVFV